MEVRLLTDADFSDEFAIVETELIDEYVGDALTAEESAQFRQYFLKSPERAGRLGFAAALNELSRSGGLGLAAPQSKRPHARRQFFPPVYLKAAAAVIAVLGVGAGAWLLVIKRPGAEQGAAVLRAAYKDKRLIESRVTGLDYAPLTVTRGREKSGGDDAALRRSELQLLKDLDEHPGAEAQHALGRFYLAGRQFDEAVEHLTAALKQRPDDARINSDLGAALLELGQQAENADEPGKASAYLTRSLEHIDKALQADRDLPEALYNRALCLQHMKWQEQAREAWRNYLARDPTSGWAEEARRNLQSPAAEVTPG